MHRVRIGTNYNEVQLPDGGSYDAGQTVILSDEEFADIRASLLGTVVIDLGEPTELFYAAGSGKLDLGGAGTFRAALANPNASGRTLRIGKLDVFCTVATFVELRLNPGTPPTGAKTESGLWLGTTNPAPVGVFTADTGADLGGGTALGLVYGIAAGQSKEIGQDIELAANNVLGINAPVAAAGSFALIATWQEV